MTDLFSVKDRVAVVTGGLGQLGREFVRQLAGVGAKVAIYSRRPVEEADVTRLFPAAPLPFP